MLYFDCTVYMYNTSSKNTVHGKSNSTMNSFRIFIEDCAILKSISFSIRRFQHLGRVGPLPGLWHSGGGGADTPTLHQTSPSNQAGFIRHRALIRYVCFKFISISCRGKLRWMWLNWISFTLLSPPSTAFPPTAQTTSCPYSLCLFFSPFKISLFFLFMQRKFTLDATE